MTENSMVAETLFRLDVWKPARLDKQLAYGEETVVRELHAEHLHEQVYSWKLKGDVWTALSGDDVGDKLKEDLISGFDCSLPPEDRDLSKMKSLIDRLVAFLHNETNRQWQTWPQSTNDDNDQDCLYQVQPLLALCQHLKWIYDIFQDVPGASITIR